MATTHTHRPTLNVAPPSARSPATSDVTVLTQQKSAEITAVLRDIRQTWREEIQLLAKSHTVTEGTQGEELTLVPPQQEELPGSMSETLRQAASKPWHSISRALMDIKEPLRDSKHHSGWTRQVDVGASYVTENLTEMLKREFSGPCRQQTCLFKTSKELKAVVVQIEI